MVAIDSFLHALDTICGGVRARASGGPAGKGARASAAAALFARRDRHGNAVEEIVNWLGRKRLVVPRGIFGGGLCVRSSCRSIREYLQVQGGNIFLSRFFRM